ncbi:MAG: NAD(P)/FAD-dependent oxidoreductase, partial [Symploca sp. SIO1C4]|nr:NAD(P)/FAD-dependent oxidoreductase [Symploca sp. SIO1C4]
MTGKTRPWVTIDQALKTIRQNNKNVIGKEFIILGAGMAGLVAAYELTKLGHKVDIYEGSKQSGGRVWTKRFDNNKGYHELGAMRIPRAHDYTNHYIKEVAKLPMVGFVNSSNEGFYYIGGTVARTTQADFVEKILPQFSGLSSDEEDIVKTNGPGALLGHYMEPIFGSLDDGDKKALLDGSFIGNPKLVEFDNKSWHCYLKNETEASDDA